MQYFHFLFHTSIRHAYSLALAGSKIPALSELNFVSTSKELSITQSRVSTVFSQCFATCDLFQRGKSWKPSWSWPCNFSCPEYTSGACFHFTSFSKASRNVMKFSKIFISDSFSYHQSRVSTNLKILFWELFQPPTILQGQGTAWIGGYMSTRYDAYQTTSGLQQETLMNCNQTTPDLWWPTTTYIRVCVAFVLCN